MFYYLDASSNFIAMAVNPVKVQSDSLNAVRKICYFYVYEALHCTVVYCFVAFLFQ